MEVGVGFASIVALAAAASGARRSQPQPAQTELAAVGSAPAVFLLDAAPATFAPRPIARVVRHTRLPVWPAWQGLPLVTENARVYS